MLDEIASRVHADFARARSRAFLSDILGFLLGRGWMGDDLSAKPCRVFIPSRLAAAMPHVVTQLGDCQDQSHRSVGVFLQIL